MFASHTHDRALGTGLPHQDHVWITAKQLFRFHKNEFDEMLCDLDSVNSHVRLNSIQPYLITPSTQSKLFPKLICFFYVETHEVSTSTRGEFTTQKNS